MTRPIAAFALVLILTGCATQRIPFPEAEIAAINTKGDVTVKGELFLINQLEEKQVGSKRDVTLEPVSSYSTQWYEVKYLGDKSIKQADPRYDKYVLKTQADPDGLFSFSGIGPGEYYLTGAVGWRALNCSAKWVVNTVLVSNRLTVKDTDSVLTVKLTKPFETPAEICDVYNQGDWEKEDLF